MLRWKFIQFTGSVMSVIFITSLISGQEKYSIEEAFKVLSFIDKVQAAQMEKGRTGLRNVTVTEKELNSYIAFRIEHENGGIMKDLRLKLFDENKVEGKVSIDLRGQNLPSLLKPEMNIFFSGRIEVKEYKVRLDLKDLFLENKRILPMVLDLIITIGSKIQGEELTSLDDWYELPYGIKDIKVKTGEAVFYY